MNCIKYHAMWPCFYKDEYLTKINQNAVAGHFFRFFMGVP